MLSNIGDISEDVHTYVLEAWVDLAPGEGPLFEGAPQSPLKVEAYVGVGCVVVVGPPLSSWHLWGDVWGYRFPAVHDDDPLTGQGTQPQAICME